MLSLEGKLHSLPLGAKQQWAVLRAREEEVYGRARANTGALPLQWRHRAACRPKPSSWLLAALPFAGQGGGSLAWRFYRLHGHDVAVGWQRWGGGPELGAVLRA